MTHKLRPFVVRQQYLMRVPLATADEKGYAGGSTTARRRSEDSSAASLPTVGPGCSEAPPSVAPRRGSTQERFCMKRASRAGSQPLEVPDGRDVFLLLWPRRSQKDRRGMPHHKYRGSRAREGNSDLPDDDSRPVGIDRLARGGGLYPRGDGKYRSLLAAGLQSPGRPIRAAGRECAAHQDRPRTQNRCQRCRLDCGVAPPWPATGQCYSLQTTTAVT